MDQAVNYVLTPVLDGEVGRYIPQLRMYLVARDNPRNASEIKCIYVGHVGEMSGNTDGVDPLPYAVVGAVGGAIVGAAAARK